MSQDKPVLSREAIMLRRHQAQMSIDFADAHSPGPRAIAMLKQDVAICDLALAALERQGSGRMVVGMRIVENPAVPPNEVWISTDKSVHKLTTLGDNGYAKAHPRAFDDELASTQAQDAQTGEKS